MAAEPPSPPRFARAQSLADLRALAGAVAGPDLSRMAARLPGVSPEALAGALGAGRLPSDAPALREALALAATLPGEGPGAFRAATAALLADALQGGPEPRLLRAYYEAHADAYRAAPAPARAAIMNGFRVAHARGLLTLELPPTPGDRATRTAAEVEAGLAGVPPKLRAPFAEALAGGPPGPTEALWRERAADLIAAPDIADAARHLYETRDDWDPWRDWPPARIAAEGVAIPFEAP